MIEGIIRTPLKQIEDERGKIMHMLRKDNEHFIDFGEIYFSQINPNITKGWKKHTQMTMQLAVVHGNIKFTFVDDRPESPTYRRHNIIELDTKEQYHLLTVPPNIWFSFTCKGDIPALLCNCASIPHSPDEAKNVPLDYEELQEYLV